MVELIKQILEFGMVGGLCFLIDYGIMIFLTEVFHTEVLISCGISFTVSVIVNYLLSMKFVFKSNGNYGRAAEFVLFIVLSVIGLGLTELLMYVGIDWLGVHYMLSKLLVTAIVMVYNFVSRKVIFEGKRVPRT